MRIEVNRVETGSLKWKCFPEDLDLAGWLKDGATFAGVA
jgi:hypothetical protein